MPTYEYACDRCGHQFEQFQSISAHPLRRCPACGRNRLQRLIGAGAGVIFKGSGFYQTDYRSESYKKAVEAETKARSKTSDSTGAKGKDSGGKADATTAKSDSAKNKGTPKPEPSHNAR
jgi:putative FmdB family regulatory protein